MKFITDKQTLEDLNMLGKYRPRSVFNIFNRTVTFGGERLLEQMFQQPLTDLQKIAGRSSVFKYFECISIDFPFDIDMIEAGELYLSTGHPENIFVSAGQDIRRRFLHFIGIREEQKAIEDGLKATINLLHAVREFVSGLLQKHAESPIAFKLHGIWRILNSNTFNWIRTAAPVEKWSFVTRIRYDHLLRSTGRKDMEAILDLIYSIDVNIAVAATAKAKHFNHAKALPAGNDCLEINEVFHPALQNATANTFSLDANRNVIFLTGANMAGKSTYMKSFGIAIYLAHMGFPVPAKQMTFSIKEGLYSSINVPDNLSLGYSHFYAEVLRVKNIAQQISAPKNLVVIFDELFKGTNVKNAFDATLAVTNAFALHRNCFFIISTHIVEVGEALQKTNSNSRFLYMPTIMEGARPRYTYRAEEGISSDKHGMMILRNERVLELIRS